MTVLYSNNFDSDTAGTVPAGWTVKTGAWAVGTSNPISGTQTLGTTTAVDQSTILYTASGSITYTKLRYSQKLTSGPTSVGHYSPILRMDSGYLNGYVWLLDFNFNTGKLTPRFYKRTGGTFPAPTTLSPMATTFAAGDQLEVECISNGSTHDIRIWRSIDTKPTSPTGTVTDATYTTGYTGLFRTGAGTVGNSVDDVVLEDNAVPAPATAVTWSGPTSGVAGTASSSFLVGADGTITGTVTVTPSDGGAGGTFTPASVQISSSTPTANFTYTASSAGTKTLSITNDGSLTNSPTSITYTAAATDTQAPSFQSAVVLNASPTVITVTMDEALAASTPPASALTVSGGKTVTAIGNPSGSTFTITVSSAYVSTDTITFTYTQPGTNPRLQDAAGNPTATTTGSVSVTNSITPVTGNVLTNGTGNVLWSPYNWDIGTSTAKTINPGAYFKTLFTGGTCTLNFDMTGISSPVPQISYLVDGVGGWTTVNIAASVTIAVPSTTSMFNAKGGHFLEVVFKSAQLTANRWTPQATALVLTGIILDAGSTITKTTALPLRGLFIGDSITEGIRTMDGSYVNDMDRANSRLSWAYQAGTILGAESGIVGFGSQGWTNAGSGGVPALTSSYNLLYSGVSRSFASAPDFIAINHGTNDSVDVTSAATTVLNALLAATPASTKIIVFRPFKDATHAAELQAAIAASTGSTRISYVDTNGWFITSNSADTLHPYGNISMNRLGPMAAAAIRTALSGTTTPTLVPRTVTLTLGDTNGALANLSGLRVAFYDEASTDVLTTPRYTTATGTTNASGVLTFSVNSTLASGGTGTVVVSMPDGRHFNGPMVVT